MILLRQKAIAQARVIAGQRREKRMSAAARARFGKDGQDVPAGYVRLESHEDRILLLRHLARQAKQEQEGRMPGDIATTALEHPAVQRDALAEVSQPPQRPVVNEAV